MMRFTGTMKKVSYITIVLGAITSVIIFWGTYGWITRTVYAVDKQANTDAHDAMPSEQTMADILDALGAITIAQKLNRDEWVCDEIDEEIPDLRKQLAATFQTGERIDIERLIEKKDEIWDALHCSKFTN